MSVLLTCTQNLHSSKFDRTAWPRHNNAKHLNLHTIRHNQHLHLCLLAARAHASYCVGSPPRPRHQHVCTSTPSIHCPTPPAVAREYHALPTMDDISSIHELHNPPASCSSPLTASDSMVRTANVLTIRPCILHAHAVRQVTPVAWCHPRSHLVPHPRRTCHRRCHRHPRGVLRYDTLRCNKSKYCALLIMTGHIEQLSPSHAID